jgi:RNA polymerase sigma factor (sigma-70 family)
MTAVPINEPGMDRGADLELARRGALADSEAVAVIVKMMAATVLRQARAATLAHQSDAEDLAQEALLACVNPKTLSRYNTNNGQCSLKSYLAAVSQKRIIGIVRTQKWQHRWDRPDTPYRDDPAPDPAELAELTDSRARLLRDFRADFETAMSRLSEPQELVVRLWAQKIPDYEVAAALNCELANVRLLRHRALLKLRRWLEGWEEFI